MKQPLKAIAAALGVVMLLTLSPSAGAQERELIMVTGNHWINASDDEKFAYLIGIGNFLQVELALQEGKKVPDNASLVPVMVRGLKGRKLTGVKEALDRWYAEHPDKLDQPVMKTIYFELALPNAK